MEFRALLLAAGLGSRLRPLTDNWPKCLMPIGERPLLEYWLETLWQSGIRSVLVNLHHRSEIVKEFLDRPQFRGWVHNVIETELLGTAGTLRANSDYFRKSKILLIHADNWCQCQFNEFLEFHSHRRPKGTIMTMMTFDSHTQESCGIVETDSRGVVQHFYEKVTNPPGNLANGAVYILEPKILHWLEQNPEVSDFSTEVLPSFLGQIAIWHNSNIHRDIGSVEALKKAQGDTRPDPILQYNDAWQNWFLKQPIIQKLSQDVV